MQLSVRNGSILVLGAGLIALGAACSSSNNNKNNAATTTSNATVAATLASTVAPAPRTATPATAATTAATRTATPSTAAVARTATPGAGAAARTASPSAAARLGTAAASGTGDAATQKALAAAALKPTDLPSGFSANGEPETAVTLPGQTASYSQTYTKIGQGANGLDVQAIVIALTSFKDTATAQAQVKDLQSSLTSQAGADITLEAITNSTKIGDQTLYYKVSGQTSGLNVAGFAIVWQRGKNGGALIQVGLPGLPNIDSLLPLAQKQDDALKSVQ